MKDLSEQDKAMLITLNKLMENYTNKALNEMKRIETIVAKANTDQEYRVSVLAENKFLNKMQKELPSILTQLKIYKYWAFGLSAFVILSIVIATCAMIF